MTRNSLLRKALEFLERPENGPQPDQKIVGKNFIDQFLKRNRLAVRSVKKFTMKTTEQIQEAAQKIHLYVFRLLGTKRIMFVLNFDEVPLLVSGRMGKVKTITSIDDKYVRVFFDPNDNKRCATGIFAVGVFLNASFAACKIFHIPPYILFKGEPKSAAILGEQHPGVAVGWTKKGVITSDFMSKHYVPQLRKAVGSNALGMALFDCAPAHFSQEVKQKFECSDFLPAFILAGFTAWLQFVDTDAACAYRKHHGDIHDVGPQPTRAKQKRAFLASAAMQASSKTMSGVNVVNSFANLGYLDPCVASLRCAPEYKFVQPNLGANDVHQDAQKLEERIAKAKASGLKSLQ